MSHVSGGIQRFGMGLLFAAAAVLSACGGGGGGGDTTGPPPGGAEQVDSLVLNLDSADVIVGDTVRLSAEARNANGQVVPGIQLSYVSSDPAVATVSDDGLVTAVDLGEAEIEVGIAGQASLRIDSRAAPSLDQAMSAGGRSKAKILSVPKVVVTPRGEQTIDPGATLQYSVSITNLNNQDLRNRPEFNWESENPAVATIDITGLATGVAEGDTHIIAKFIVPGNHVRKISVPLHVAVCGGILRVATWTAAADAEYNAGGTSPTTGGTYKVHQISTGGGSLTQVPLESGPDSTVWEGKVAGDVTLDNSVTFPIGQGQTGITIELLSGPILDGPTALARLVVKRPSAGSLTCTYSFQYSDYFRWELTNNQGAPPTPLAGPTGTALYLGAEVGGPPAAGELWHLGNRNSVQLPGRILLGPNGLLRSGYSPGTYLGIGIITILGTPPADPSYGQATFAYDLTGAR